MAYFCILKCLEKKKKSSFSLSNGGWCSIGEWNAIRSRVTPVIIFLTRCLLPQRPNRKLDNYHLCWIVIFGSSFCIYHLVRCRIVLLKESSFNQVCAYCGVNKHTQLVSHEVVSKHLYRCVVQDINVTGFYQNQLWSVFGTYRCCCIKVSMVSGTKISILKVFHRRFHTDVLPIIK